MLNILNQSGTLESISVPSNIKDFYTTFSVGDGPDYKQPFIEMFMPQLLDKKSMNLLNDEISKSKPTFVMWSGISKMALYLYEVPYMVQEIKLKDDLKPNTTEADDFIWLKLSDYPKYLTENSDTDIKFHQFNKHIAKIIAKHLVKISTKPNQTKPNQTKPQINLN